MNRLLELKQQRAVVIDRAKALNQKAADEKRTLTSDEATSFETMWTEIRGFNATIDALDKEGQMDAAISRTRERHQEQEQRDIRDGKKKPQDSEERRRAFHLWLRGGMEIVPNELRKELTPGNQFSADFTQNGGGEFRTNAAQSELTGNLGGFVVPQGFYAQVQEALLYYNGVMQAGPTIIDTSMGNDLPVPTDNDTSNMGTELAESSPISYVTIPFGQVILKAFKYSSNGILVPIELLQDAGVDIEAHVIKKIGIRMGRILNLRFTSGSGSGQPRGLLADAPAGVTTTGGQTTSVIYDNIVDLKYSVNKSYRTNAKWMLNDTTLQALLKLKDQNLRPLILDYLTTLQAGEPEQLLGQPIIVNNDMPSMGAGNQFMLYGDFSNYWVRRVMNMMIMRLVERYADVGQVGFIAFMRYDGRMIDAGTHPIKALVNASS